MKILSIDIGTSSLKMAVLSENNQIIDMTTMEYQYRVFNYDWVELQADQILDALREGCLRLSEHLGEVEIIAYETFSPSLVFMDRNGDPLHPVITHLDRRSKKQTEIILNTMGKEAFQGITGVQPFTGGVSITTVMWMMENLPEVFRDTYKFGHLSTFIYHKLTGCWASDPTDASMMGLYETLKWSTWSKDILNTFNIPESKLPPIHNAGTVLGTLKKDPALLMGLREGIPVVLGSNDAATAHLGCGNFKEGDILNVSGSSEIISIITDKPVINDNYYIRNAIFPGKWQIFAITIGGFAIDWFRKEFYKDMNADDFFCLELPDVIDNYVDKTSAVFSPYLAGDRQSLIPRKGAFNGLTLDTTRKDLLAAIAVGIHEHLIKVLELSGSFVTLNKRIKLTGGLSSGPYINLKRKLMKDFDFEVIQNAPLLGNGLLALEAVTI